MKKSIKILAGLTCAVALTATAYAASSKVSVWLNVLGAGKVVVKTMPSGLADAGLSAVSFKMQPGTSNFDSLTLGFYRAVPVAAVSAPAFLQALIGVVNAAGTSQCNLASKAVHGAVATVLCHAANLPLGNQTTYNLSLAGGNKQVIIQLAS